MESETDQWENGHCLCACRVAFILKQLIVPLWLRYTRSFLLLIYLFDTYPSHEAAKLWDKLFCVGNK